MSDYTGVLARILDRTYYATHGKPLYDSRKWAAEVFETLLAYHGLAVVTTCRFAIDDECTMVVSLTDDGNVQMPKLGRTMSPDLAHRLGVALIGVARSARELAANE